MGTNCEPKSPMRNMEVVSNQEAEQAGWKVVVPCPGELVGKTTYNKEGTGIMKSTKRFKVPGGWLYNISTEIHENGNVSVAEALEFVPDQQ